MTYLQSITFLNPNFTYMFYLFQHWQCKAFFSWFNYILAANYMWIFMEGIYLHMLISVAMFSERSNIKKLIMFGWGTYDSKFKTVALKAGNLD